MLTLPVNLIGLFFIGLILWWFLLKKITYTTVNNNKIQIIVDEGIDAPPVLKARKGIPLLLEFVRKDKSPCTQVVSSIRWMLARNYN